MSNNTEFTGTVGDVFAHRFTLATEQGNKLIDLGPGGEKAVKVAPGQQVSVKGEDKPAEVKAHAIRIAEGEWQQIKADHKQPPHGEPAAGAEAGEHPEPELAHEHVTKLLDDAGYTDHGDHERKPKHVEVAASKDGQRHKVHVHKDGVKKADPVA